MINADKVKRDYLTDDGWHIITFRNDECFFRKWKTLPIPEATPELTSKGTEVRWLNRGLVLRLPNEILLKHVPSPIPNQTKDRDLFYHIPVAKFELQTGSPNWIDDLETDFNLVIKRKQTEAKASQQGEETWQ